MHACAKDTSAISLKVGLETGNDTGNQSTLVGCLPKQKMWKKENDDFHTFLVSFRWNMKLGLKIQWMENDMTSIVYVTRYVILMSIIYSINWIKAVKCRESTDYDRMSIFDGFATNDPNFYIFFVSFKKTGIRRRK